VTEDQVLRYLRKRLPDININVSAVKTKYNSYTSFHVTSHCPDPSVFMDCNLWPKNAFVRWWRENRDRKDTNTQGLASLDEVTLAKTTTGHEEHKDDGIAQEFDGHNTQMKVA
jgi:hypothetical protein